MHRLQQLLCRFIHLPNGHCQYYLRFESFRFSQLYSLPLEYTSKSQVFKSFIVYLLSFRLMNTQVCLFVRIDTISLFNLFVRLFGFWIDMTRLDSIRFESTWVDKTLSNAHWKSIRSFCSVRFFEKFTIKKNPLKRSNIWTFLKYMLRIRKDISLG